MNIIYFTNNKWVLCSTHKYEIYTSIPFTITLMSKLGLKLIHKWQKNDLKTYLYFILYDISPEGEAP